MSGCKKSPSSGIRRNRKRSLDSPRICHFGVRYSHLKRRSCMVTEWDKVEDIIVHNGIQMYFCVLCIMYFSPSENHPFVCYECYGCCPALLDAFQLECALPLAVCKWIRYS
ncbi:hypothetical protein AAFF_G00326350 [Aldrovandia affinis]|uniref:Uncharacterized protein n=1 Tax=Aldrovandia affinis TaxID=143900 RepID=A0AAD7X1A2_9TELE|nr:hypothetical protein AAFF_G00326350 [Aldrovandia affinis]